MTDFSPCESLVNKKKGVCIHPRDGPLIFFCLYSVPLTLLVGFKIDSLLINIQSGLEELLEAL